MTGRIKSTNFGSSMYFFHDNVKKKTITSSILFYAIFNTFSMRLLHVPLLTISVMLGMSRD